MAICQFGFIHGDQPLLPDDNPATDHRIVNADGLTEDDRRHGIVESASELETVQVQREEVGAFAGFERADVRAAQEGEVARALGESQDATLHKPGAVDRLYNPKQGNFIRRQTEREAS